MDVDDPAGDSRFVVAAVEVPEELTTSSEDVGGWALDAVGRVDGVECVGGVDCVDGVDWESAALN